MRSFFPPTRNPVLAPSHLALLILCAACGGGNSAGNDTSAGGAPSGGTSSAGAGGSSNTAGAGGSEATNGGSGATAGTVNGGSESGGSSSGGSGASAGDGGSSNYVACIPSAAGAPGDDQEPGTWRNVTPEGLDLESTDVGAGALLVDPAKPSDAYINIQHRGTFKSTDYGCTWEKVNTGTNGEKLDSGYAAYGAIERDSCRNPNTPPILYFVQLFGDGGIWKSTDGGVSYEQVWTDHVFDEDGVTSISADVGGDLHSVAFIDPGDSDHLLASLHGYGGSGENNGVFETTDGGEHWIVHKSQVFSFQPHNSVLFPISADTWLVTPGTVSSDNHYYRTTDGAASWTDLGDAPARGIGRTYFERDGAIYTGTDYNGGAYKSTDQGQTFVKYENAGGQMSWVVASATKLYASSGYVTAPTVRSADIDVAADGLWTDMETTVEMDKNGTHADITFDGSHYILLAAQHTSGIWRYVEP
jgi:hypothetical protein